MPSPVVNAFIELQGNGLATRGGLEAGRLLVACQHCARWKACVKKPGKLAKRLCDVGYWCERWTELHQR